MRATPTARSNRLPTFEVDHQVDVELYAEQVLSGEIPACKWVKLAVERQVRDLAKPVTDDWPWVFDWERAIKPIRFIELKPHVKGHWAGRAGSAGLIVLSPWQKFIIAVIFGWVRQDNGLRRFKLVYICVARKQGKSTLASGIGLYMLAADDEHGAEVYCGATSRDQAWEVFGPAVDMVKAQPQFRRYYGVEAMAQKITAANRSKMRPIIGNPGDGSSPSCSITDEYHEHQDDDQYETMVGGMGARQQPIALVITTAGDNSDGPCYDMQEEIQELLEQGGDEMPEQFGIVFTLDDDDDWTNLEHLKKANPNFGVSVSEDYLQVRLKAAKNNAARQNKFRTRHANQWVSARNAWMNMLEWDACEDPEACDPKRLQGWSYWGGLDMSSTNDLTVSGKIFREQFKVQARDRERLMWRYMLLVRIWCTEARINDPDNPYRKQYQRWAHEGHLLVCDGNMIDYDEVEDDVFSDAQEFVLEDMAYDPWGAEHLAQRVGKRCDIEPVKVPPAPSHISETMFQWGDLVADRRLLHEGNPCMRWMMSNVIAKEYEDGKRIKPVKARRAKKIDGPVAGMMALKVAIMPDEDDPDEGMSEYLQDPVTL